MMRKLSLKNRNFSSFFSTALILILASTLMLSMGCKNNDEDNPNPDEPDAACELTLYDGNNFTDDHITLKGPGEFADLSNLPNADKDWNDEADSFKAGENAVVTFYSETNFKGNSIVYDAGEEKGSVDEPSSIKIECQ